MYNKTEETDEKDPKTYTNAAQLFDRIEATLAKRPTDTDRKTTRTFAEQFGTLVDTYNTLVGFRCLHRDYKKWLI